MEEENTQYTISIIDTKTQEVICSSSYNNRKRIRNKCEKLNQLYGAIRYTTRMDLNND